MLEVLQFVFSSFWVFLGTVILLSVLAKVIIGTIAIIAGRGNVHIE